MLLFYFLGNGITLQAARYSSEDAAQIVEYVQLVIQFTRKYTPYTRTLESLNFLKKEKEDEEESLMKVHNKSNEEEKNVEVIHLGFFFFTLYFLPQCTHLIFNFFRGSVIRGFRISKSYYRLFQSNNILGAGAEG